MTRALVPPVPPGTGGARSLRRLAVLGSAAVLILAACGGDDDGDDVETTTPSTFATDPPAVITSPPSATLATLPPIDTGPTPVSYVTEGATVMVANASRINGAAGRMTERLAGAGYQMVEAGNYTLGQLETTTIYYDPAQTAAQAVADSLKGALGGGAIEVLELPAPPPTEAGTVNGAGVLVAMGNDTADKTLDELQGITTTTTAPAAGSTSPSTTAG